MKDLGIPTGDWRFAQVTMNQYIHCDGKVICNITKRFEKETKAVGELIADAGNVAQKCGLLPSELLKQRDELFAALKEIAECKGAYSMDRLEHATNVIKEAKAIAEAAITKAEERNTDIEQKIVKILHTHGAYSIDTFNCIPDLVSLINQEVAEMPTEEEAISRLLDEYYMTKINTDEEKKKFKISVIKFTTWFRNRMKPNQ
jgi:hypothetical protein